MEADRHDCLPSIKMIGFIFFVYMEGFYLFLEDSTAILAWLLCCLHVVGVLHVLSRLDDHLPMLAVSNTHAHSARPN